jgi:hypothetical protein
MSTSKRENIEKARAAVNLGAEGIPVLHEILDQSDDLIVQLQAIKSAANIGSEAKAIARRISGSTTNLILLQASAEYQPAEDFVDLQTLLNIAAVTADHRIVHKAAWAATFLENNEETSKVLWAFLKKATDPQALNSIAFHAHASGNQAEEILEAVIQKTTDSRFNNGIGYSAARLGVSGIKFLEKLLEKDPKNFPNYSVYGGALKLGFAGVPVLDWIFEKLPNCAPFDGSGSQWVLEPGGIGLAWYLLGKIPNDDELSRLLWDLDADIDIPQNLLEAIESKATSVYSFECLARIVGRKGVNGIPYLSHLLEKAEKTHVLAGAAYGAGSAGDDGITLFEWIIEHSQHESILTSAAEGCARNAKDTIEFAKHLLDKFPTEEVFYALAEAWIPRNDQELLILQLILEQTSNERTLRQLIRNSFRIIENPEAALDAIFQKNPEPKIFLKAAKSLGLFDHSLTAPTEWYLSRFTDYRIKKAVAIQSAKRGGIWLIYIDQLIDDFHDDDTFRELGKAASRYGDNSPFVLEWLLERRPHQQIVIGAAEGLANPHRIAALEWLVDSFPEQNLYPVIAGAVNSYQGQGLPVLDWILSRNMELETLLKVGESACKAGSLGIPILSHILDAVPANKVHFLVSGATHRDAEDIDLELLTWLLDQPKFHGCLSYFAHAAGRIGAGGRGLLRRVFEINSSVEIAESAAYSFGRHGVDSINFLEWISSKEPDAEVWTQAVQCYTEVRGCAGDLEFIEECVARSDDPDILLEIGESAGSIGRQCAIKILEWVLERCSSPNLFERIGFGAGMSHDGLPILEWIITKTDNLDPLGEAAYMCSYDDETGEFPVINWILERYDDPFLLSRCSGCAMENHPEGIPAMEKILAKCNAPVIWEEAAFGAAWAGHRENLKWVFERKPLPSVYLEGAHGAGNSHYEELVDWIFSLHPVPEVFLFAGKGVGFSGYGLEFLDWLWTKSAGADLLDSVMLGHEEGRNDPQIADWVAAKRTELD